MHDSKQLTFGKVPLSPNGGETMWPLRTALQQEIPYKCCQSTQWLSDISAGRAKQHCHLVNASKAVPVMASLPFMIICW